MKLFGVFYSIYRKSDGEILTDCEAAFGMATSKATAQILLVREIRTIFSEDKYGIIIHDVQTAQQNE